MRAFSKITVEPAVGTYIEEFIAELNKLSSKYHCEVHGKFNDRDIIVKYN